VFFTRPLSLAFLVLAAAMLIVVALPGIRHGREKAFKEA
jgi:TctA family transporter